MPRDAALHPFALARPEPTAERPLLEALVNAAVAVAVEAIAAGVVLIFAEIGWVEGGTALEERASDAALKAASLAAPLTAADRRWG